MAKKNIATIKATHFGFVNNNNTYYLEDNMDMAINSWTVPFNKPVLVHHEMKQDAIGRVLTAQHVKMEKSTKANYPSSYMLLTAEINDAEAITKIKDKRYNTVSISTNAGVAICSICGQDIAKKGICEHKRGQMYDGEKCFWYLGSLRYTEVSYVNAPADEYAETERFEEKEISIRSKDSSESTPTFNDNVEHAASLVKEWDTYTDDDLVLAHWLIVELDNEMSSTDSKLSEKDKKRMKSSAFCGPNRSFPVPDCAHVTAAKRLIDKYKGPGDKSKILNCVSKKAKSLGCDSNNDSIIEGESMSITLKDALETDVVKQYIDSQILQATQPLKDQLLELPTLIEKVKTKDSELVAKDLELTSSKELTKKLEDSVAQLKSELHSNLVDRVYSLRKSLQKKDVLNLKDETEVSVYKADLSKRTDESLSDAISDLSKEDIMFMSNAGPVTSQADSIEVVNAADTSAVATKSNDNKSRKDRVKALIFKD